MKVDVQELIGFTQFANAMTSIERAYFIKDSGRKESDAEHSYQVALMAWWLITKHKLKLNLERALGYALVHDLVEIYAGDTFYYSEGEHADSKHEREAAAHARIAENFPEVAMLIQGYEARKDNESTFIYALDKLMPIINVYSNGGMSWREEGVTFAMLKKKKGPQAALDPTVRAYYEQIVNILQAEEAQLFGT